MNQRTEMAKFKVFCTYKANLNPSDFEHVNLKINQNSALTRDELLNEVNGCHGILSNPRCPRIDAEILDAAGPQLKVISTSSAGYAYIDIQECTKRGILVGYLPDTFTEAVAEVTVGLILSVSRKIVEATHLAKTMDWNQINEQRLLTGKSVRGSVVGIFGLGKIGTAIAKRLSSFGIKKVIYTNRKVNDEAEKLNYEFVEFDELLRQSDYLVCAASLNNESANTFDKTAFSKMKKTSCFFNVGRGGMVNHEDLYQALLTKTIHSAGIDVTAPEPLPKENGLYTLSNCVITPHIAGDDEMTREDLYRVSLANLINGLNGQPLVHQIQFS